MMRFAVSPLMFCAAFAMVGAAQTTTEYQRTSGSEFVSPSVIATTMIRYPTTDQANLQLLVLWRGKPGWWLNGGSSSGGTFTQEGREYYVTTSKYRSVSISVKLDPATHVAWVQGEE